MSEFIDNVTRRKETLKNILRQLHAGKSVDEVKAQFAALADEITAEEIAEVEQMLISEGLPVSEISNLCDVHVAVVREALERSGSPDTTPGHPLHTFKLENAAVDQTLTSLRRALENFKTRRDEQSLTALQRQAALLQEYERHYSRKENILFPFLEKKDFYGPSQVMWQIHDQIRALWNSLRGALPKQPAADGASLDEIEATLNSLEQTLRDMVYKEEKILFPTALNLLDEADWLAVRRQEAEIGYYIVQPGNRWPVSAQTLHSPQAEPVGFAAPLKVSTPEKPQSVPTGEGQALPLNTGALTLKQIDLLLTHLPVDVTYVDENDEVRYFSQTRERIFTRTPAVIGRKVQNCHPPQSVHRVTQIVESFRSGVRDSAEFWIQMGERFIHIAYYAIRDEKGVYRGTLEVSQDATHLRSLSGERRLLDGAG